MSYFIEGHYENGYWVRLLFGLCKRRMHSTKRIAVSIAAGGIFIEHEGARSCVMVVNRLRQKGRKLLSIGGSGEIGIAFDGKLIAAVHGEQIMTERIYNVRQRELDEVWAFVKCKQKRIRPK